MDILQDNLINTNILYFDIANWRIPAWFGYEVGSTCNSGPVRVWLKNGKGFWRPFFRKCGWEEKKVIQVRKSLQEVSAWNVYSSVPFFKDFSGTRWSWVAIIAWSVTVVWRAWTLQGTRARSVVAMLSRRWLPLIASVKQAFFWRWIEEKRVLCTIICTGGNYMLYSAGINAASPRFCKQYLLYS